MPADVSERSSSGSLQETMSGAMTLVGPAKHRQNVNVKVYRTSLEHFAVLYPQKKVCRPLGVVNLRNTVVEPLAGDKQAGFVVRQRGFDTPMCLTFLSESARDLDSWLVAFASRSSPAAAARHSPLPILQEDDEF